MRNQKEEYMVSDRVWHKTCSLDAVPAESGVDSRISFHYIRATLN